MENANLRTLAAVCLALMAGQASAFATGAEEPQVDSAKIFVKTCAGCHGKDGKARTPMARKLGVKDLTKSAIQEKEIARQIREGRKDKAGNQKMPAFEDQLSEEEIQALVQFVRSLRKPR